MGYQLWEDLLLGRIAPSISGTISAFILVYILMRLFRVRNPGTRYLLYHLPLIEGFVILLRGVPSPLAAFRDRPRFGFQIFDPFSMVKIPDLSFELQSPGVGIATIKDYPQYDLALAAFFTMLGAAIGILLYRWIGMSLFYRRILSTTAAARSDAPALFDMLDRFVPALGVTIPRIILTDEPAMSPCTVGINPPTIVLPYRLVRELSADQLEAILAHELAHVSRRDGLFHWPSLMLRDLQAFNPLSHWLFTRIMVERELDTDTRAAAVTGHPRAMAKALVDIALLAKGVSLRPAPGAMSFRENLMGSTSVVEQRMQALLAGPVASSRLRGFGILLLLLYLLLVRVYIQLPLIEHVVILE